MLLIKHITKSFGGVKAIQGSNFEIQDNQVTALIGPNGAGKTTLFDLITGFLRPDSGQVLFQGKDTTKMASYKIARLGISRTFQQVRLFRYLTILDHLRMVEDHEDIKLLKNMFIRKKIDHKKYQAILDVYGIKRDLNTLVSELSYGQRKLLQLALAVAQPHTLLLLDEPVAGVNKVMQKQIEDILLGLKKKGETMILIDHDMEFIARLADHVIVLDAGVVLVEGEPKKVLKDPRVLEAYLGE